MPHDSNHPSEHKISAIKYLVNRLTNYPLSDTHKYTEYSTIKHILHNNKYNYTIIDHLTPPLPPYQPIQTTRTTRIVNRTQNNNKRSCLHSHTRVDILTTLPSSFVIQISTWHTRPKTQYVKS